MEEDLTSRLGTLQKHWELEKKSLFSTLETLQSANKLIEMQINYKLGSFEGKIKKRQVDDIVLDNVDAAQAIEAANRIREQQGLPPLVVPEIKK